MKNGPIFIVGAPRSGTTLLQYMLRSHPRISMPTGESHFIVPLLHNASAFGDLSCKSNLKRVLQDMYRRSTNFVNTDLHGLRFDIDVLTERYHSRGLKSVDNLIRAVFEDNARGEGKVRWGEKTPYYSLHIPLIANTYPDAQFVHIVRDGRDCALSMLSRRYDLNIHNVYEAVRIWKQYVETAEVEGSRLGGNRYFEFRYEDLLQSEESTIRAICGFLGEEFSESVINFKKSSCKVQGNLLTQPVQKDNTGKWMHRMSSRQLRAFEATAGSTLRKHGYELYSTGGSLSQFEQLWYQLHQRYCTGRTRKFL